MASLATAHTKPGTKIRVNAEGDMRDATVADAKWN
jgi:hypothetical protein